MVQVVCNTYTSNDENITKHFSRFPFELSSFQKYSIDGIINGNHVLVTAHTGSGKTLPAEFSIEYFTSLGKKVIYTSPIKALSNQKFHEFQIKFPNISFGILTGDIKFNPEADVLIMTTEILRNTLYMRKSNVKKSLLDFDIDIDNELGCVVFDEIHYINDADRGKIWEESIMMLPSQIQMVMLSATIDKADKFAQWIENAKITDDIKKDVILTGTNHRVVPLVHYMYFATHDKVIKNIKDKPTVNLFQNTANILHTIKDTSIPTFNDAPYYAIQKMAKYIKINNVSIKRSFVLNKLVQHLNDNEMLPAIFFVFSRKQCEVCANEISTSLFEKGSSIPQTIEKECQHIIMKIPNYKEYINLPEYDNMIKLLCKGIAVHHSGIMPVLREMIELLFAKGYIKLLFATETFAVGINMPTKTVVFTGFSKFNGDSMRMLHSHEYTQMAGRAGRRGLDTIGHVIHCNNLFEVPILNSYSDMLNGKSQKLVSKFKISYNIIMNIIAMNNVRFIDHISNSMMNLELLNELSAAEKYIDDLKSAYDDKNKLFNNMFNDNIKDEFQEYCNAIDILAHGCSQKQRKKLQLYVNNFEESNRNIKTYVDMNKVINQMRNDIKQETININSMKSYIQDMIDNVVDVLMANQYIESSDNSVSSYALTLLGKQAVNIQEMHPLVFMEVFTKYNQFNNFTTNDIIALFSCFTNIRVQEDYKVHLANTTNEELNECANYMKSTLERFQDDEYSKQMSTGDNNDFHFDLMTTMYDWCNATDELTCKTIIQTIQFEKGVFLGEFIKAILKINNMSNELTKICEICGNIDLQNKLQHISEKTLKYIATNQSLYI